ncbi:MAG: hypothetical protein COB02_06000 [Candidatus Cloacimonadota bacterium]|nr:MAG: hypothetical protein COB02_12090 [Candidatus Cloacimonadota bacterium]PCJ20151.1 MAG: hypothetical protein COB02_06000 [Candidatus Cloacimonadota bacterium]
MKKLILFFLIAQSLHASTRKYIYSVGQLKAHLLFLINHQKRNPRDLKYLHNEIRLVHGFYYIKKEDTFFTDLLKSLEKESRFFTFKSRFIIQYQYNQKQDRVTKYNMGVTQTLKFFDQHLKTGIKFSRESRFIINKEKDLLKFLPKIAKNRSDTVLILNYCLKSPCIRNPQLIDKIPKIMKSNDGMSLRVASKFHSQEKNKYRYFQSSLQPFAP